MGEITLGPGSHTVSTKLLPEEDIDVSNNGKTSTKVLVRDAAAPATTAAATSAPEVAGQDATTEEDKLAAQTK